MNKIKELIPGKLYAINIICLSFHCKELQTWNVLERNALVMFVGHNMNNVPNTGFDTITKLTFLYEKYNFTLYTTLGEIKEYMPTWFREI